VDKTINCNATTNLCPEKEVVMKEELWDNLVMPTIRQAAALRTA